MKPSDRLFALITVAGIIWIYAVITDHPAPAWGPSRLSEIAISAISLVILSLPFIGTFYLVRYSWRRRYKGDTISEE